MTTLADTVTKIRSKNAGPFWVTVDIFCGSKDRFEQLTQSLSTEAVAQLYRVSPETLKRFDIANLNVIKFSFPRPVPQGAPLDRDQHGAQYAVLLEELTLA
ncbi:DUF4387 family protein [Tropicibacter oceani]|uniref:DUF4387 family protein n=1 Tax=Tropicibacter oceani TaxID=3058420 RepID=A0ABY8QG61_9RHOB|nr:DUF4387 family protein [Tropicibacter oceani]WGW03607.1 DUF4387 family protein [Tropicibacter oceani]